MSDAEAFAKELVRRLRDRAQEYMHIAEQSDPNDRVDMERRDRVITRAIAFSEIADLIDVAAKETWL